VVAEPIVRNLVKQARKIKLLLTDCDGVLTDAGVYYSAEGEQMKRFSVRDGMGVERLRKFADVDTGIITGEVAESVKRRAEKLKIKHLYLGIRNKKIVLEEIATRENLAYDQIAYIGDDINDFQVMQLVGLTGCPSDAMPEIRNIADYQCVARGGFGAFREFSEIIIEAKTKSDEVEK